MNNSEIDDPLFREAVDTIDAGDIDKLQRLLDMHPGLVLKRAQLPHEGYFHNPYLLWFVAENPVRNGKLPANILEVTTAIIEAVKKKGVDNLVEQLDYTLALVATGRVPKECGVQIQLMDLLIDAGARPGGALGALMHGNPEAAMHLIERGGRLTLAAAICLDLSEDIKRLAKVANEKDLQIALAAAAYCGKADKISMLIDLGVDINAFNPDSLHSHSTALHQAISSGSIGAVKTLVEAGADLHTRDKVYFGPPLGWAMYAHQTAKTDEQKKTFSEIVGYIRQSLATSIANNMISAGIVEKKNKAEAIDIIAREIDT